MAYELLSIDGKTVVFEAPDYNSMWVQLMDFRDTQLDKNIDGMIIRNTISGKTEYAWKVAIQLQEINID